MACEDQITPTDLTNAKDDAVTLAEIATSKEGGVSTGDLIFNSTDRFGNSHLTSEGALARIQANPINGGVWAVGITFNAYNDYMIYTGVAYKPKSTTTLPYVSEAVPNVANVEPFSLNDAGLVDLTINGVDTDVSAYLNAINVDDYAAMIANHAVAPYIAGTTIHVTDLDTSGLFSIVYDVAHGVVSTAGVRVALDVDHYAQRLDLDGSYNSDWYLDPSAGYTDETIPIQNCVNEATLDAVATFISGGNHQTSSPIILPAGSSIFGMSGPKARKRSRITNTTTEAITTDDSISAFSGIKIKDLRISGGVTGLYGVESHYPRTEISGIYIEDNSPTYAGKGIRLHNDGGQSGMGCWDSTIKESLIVLEENDLINKRIALDLYINGGNVHVDNVDVVNTNEFINVRHGQDIRVTGCTFNKARDVTSFVGNIRSAGIVVGTDTASIDEITFDVETLSVSNCYLEGYSRLILMRNACNVSIKDCLINDIQAWDPNSDSINEDGTFYTTSLSSGLEIDNCFYTNGYSFQRVVFAEDKASEAFLSFSIKNTILNYRNYRASGGITLFNTSKDYSLENVTHVWTIADLSRESKVYVDTPATLQGSDVFVHNTWTDIGDIDDGETWYVSASVAGYGIDRVYQGYVLQNEAVGEAYPVNTPDRIDVRVNADKVQILQTDNFGNDRTVKWSLKNISKIVD